MSSYLDFTVDALFTMMQPLTVYGYTVAATDADRNVYYLGGEAITNKAGAVRISTTVAELTQGDAPVVQVACWLREQGAPFMEQALDRNGRAADADTAYPNAGYQERSSITISDGGSVTVSGKTAGYMK